MKILRIGVRDFRGIAEREITLTPDGITVVEGDNETGKSSLVEGLGLLLDKPDSSRDSRVRAVCPVHTDAGPQAEAEITSGPYRFTYRKRWLKRSETMLVITEPQPEQLTGHQAHERAREILAETADMNLWAALRIEQAQPLKQAGLNSSPALGRALDLATGGAVAGDDEAAADLLTRAQQEYLKHHTPTGQHTGQYRDAERESEAADAELRSCQEQLAAVDSDITAADSARRELEKLELRRAEHGPLLQEMEKRYRDLQRRQAGVRLSEEQARTARLQADDAKRASDDRHDLASEVTRLADELTALDDEQRRMLEELATARHRAEQAKTSSDSLAADYRAAGQQAERAADDQAHLNDIAAQGALSQRTGRASAALEHIDAAAREIATCPVTENLLREIQEAHDTASHARVRMEAAAAEVRVEALAQVTIERDGTLRELGSGEHDQWPVTGTSQFTVPGVIRVRILPGIEGEDLREALATADRQFSAFTGRAGVADLAQARAIAEQRRAAEQRKAIAQQALTAELDDLTVEELRSSLAELTGRTSAYAASRPAIPPPPDSLEQAREILGEARQHALRLREQAADAERQAASAASTARDLDENTRLRTQKITGTRTELDRLDARLTGQRAKEPDDVLTERLRQTLEEAHRADERWRHEADALAAAGLGDVQTELTNERAVGERLERDAAQLKEERIRLTERVMVGGRQEDYDAAATRQAAAQRQLESLRRQAKAAELAWRTLDKHRAEAHRKYVAPFREQLERFGRIVFGPALHLEIGEDLQVIRRTLDRVTVPFESLSGGTKEQLCLCARLACAALVNPEEGAPVIIDDALGYTDPQRLRQMGAVFAEAGKSCQVIVLTCVPERYRSIGPATVQRVR